MKSQHLPKCISNPNTSIALLTIHDDDHYLYKNNTLQLKQTEDNSVNLLEVCKWTDKCIYLIADKL